MPATTEKPSPDATPQAGGSYLRDDKTGEMRRVETPAEPPAEGTTPAANKTAKE